MGYMLGVEPTYLKKKKVETDYPPGSWKAVAPLSETSLTIQGASEKKYDVITFPSKLQGVIPSASRKVGTLVSKARFPLKPP